MIISIKMETVTLIIKDNYEQMPLIINKKLLANKCDYFEILFTKFIETTMDEIIIIVPDTKIMTNIIKELLGENVEIPINKMTIECYDFLSLKYDHLLEKITDVEELLDIGDKHDFTENIIKLIAKKNPKKI